MRQGHEGASPNENGFGISEAVFLCVVYVRRGLFEAVLGTMWESEIYAGRFMYRL